MNRYEILERLGDGTFGEVLKARSLKTNEIVAIKKLKGIFHTWEECLQLRELKSLKQLRHENIIQLKEVVREKEELYFVFEYMKSSLCHLMRPKTCRGANPMSLVDDKTSGGVGDLAGAVGGNESTGGGGGGGGGTCGAVAFNSGAAPLLFTEAQIRSILFQLFSGLAHMHKHGFFHRDIKPENLLCHDDTLKIADLGQAREIRSCPPFTEYVATRWYRSPELLLHATTYNSPIDMWACGCIMAELYSQAPIFPGSSEADQMCRICKVLGTPTKESWPEGMTLVSKMQFKFPKCSPIPLKSLFPQVNPSAVQLITELLQYDPSRRPTASQALQHRYFAQGISRPILIPVEPCTDEKQVENEAVRMANANLNSNGLPSNRSSSSFGLVPAKAELKLMTANFGMDAVKQTSARVFSMASVLDMDQDIKELQLQRAITNSDDNNDKSGSKPARQPNQNSNHHHHHHHRAHHKSVGGSAVDLAAQEPGETCCEPRGFVTTGTALPSMTSSSSSTAEDSVVISARADSKRGSRRHHPRQASFKNKKTRDQEVGDKSDSARNDARPDPQSQEMLLQDLLDEFFA